MDFLVRVDYSRAYDLPENERTAPLDRERSRVRELLSQGVIQQLWRVHGTRANIGIWSAADANALEEALASLPTRPYTQIDVTAPANYTPQDGHRVPRASSPAKWRIAANIGGT
jgi:muconolactone D-isomerase